MSLPDQSASALAGQLPSETAATGPWKFRLVTEFSELQALAPVWQELLEATAGAEPMQSPAWLLTWWQIYGAATGRRLRVGLFYEQNQLVGLAPLCARRFWYRPGIPFTRLEFLGSDVDEQDGVCSIYLNLLARAGLEKNIAEAFVQELARGSFGPWHEGVMSAMNGAEPMGTFLLAAFSAACYQGAQQITTQAPYLTLPSTWDAYLQSLNTKHRRSIKLSMRDFETWAGTDWKLEQARTAEELAKGQRILADLHNQRWQQGEGSGGAYAAPRFDAFHRAYMPLSFRENKLQILCLTVRGEPVVAHYQLVANNKVYFYLCGRSPNVPAPVRPGIVMAALAVQKAIADGLREFDFLGDPAEYKLKFTRTVRPIIRIRVARGGPREWLRRGAETAIGYARVLRNKVRALRVRDKPLLKDGNAE